MGQQQLILLVLATVIVGVAIVVGIRAFTENSAKSNADAMMQDAVRIANDAQAWKKKPTPFGGQDACTDADGNAAACTPVNFTGATFSKLGYEATGTPATYTNLNGSFTITPSATNLTIAGANTDEGNAVTVLVCGINDGNIDGAITTLGGTATGETPTCVAG